MEKSLLMQSSSKVPQTLSLRIFPSESLIMPEPLSFLEAFALKVETSISSFRLKTWTKRNLFPIIRDDLKIFLTSSGVASVETSKSFALIPTRESRTHQPTRYPLKPDCFNFLTTSIARGLNLFSLSIFGIFFADSLCFLFKSLKETFFGSAAIHQVVFL